MRWHYIDEFFSGESGVKYETLDVSKLCQNPKDWPPINGEKRRYLTKITLSSFLKKHGYDLVCLIVLHKPGLIFSPDLYGVCVGEGGSLMKFCIQAARNFSGKECAEDFFKEIYVKDYVNGCKFYTPIDAEIRFHDWELGYLCGTVDVEWTALMIHMQCNHGVTLFKELIPTGKLIEKHFEHIDLKDEEESYGCWSNERDPDYDAEMLYYGMVEVFDEYGESEWVYPSNYVMELY